MKDADAAPRGEVPPRAARLAASVGTAVIALSLVVLSYEAVAAWIQTSFVGSGLLSEPGDLLRQWLLLGGWSAPGRTPFGEWLLHRAGDVLMLVVVWWTLRLLPRRLTRITLLTMTVGTICATVLGLLARQVVQATMSGTASVRGPLVAVLRARRRRAGRPGLRHPGGGGGSGDTASGRRAGRHRRFRRVTASVASRDGGPRHRRDGANAGRVPHSCVVVTPEAVAARPMSHAAGRPPTGEPTARKRLPHLIDYR